MGKIPQGAYGAMIGKTGNLVGGSWKGIDYVRIMPASVSNPQTQPQMEQRQKFSLAMGVMQPMSQFLRTGFKLFAIRMTAFNAAFSHNIKNAIAGAYPNFTIDYPNVRVAQGELAPALNAVAAAGAAGTAVYTWDDNSTEIGAAATDKTLIVIYNAVKHQAVTVSELAERATGTQTVTVPDSWSGDTVQCYLAFQNLLGTSVANSAYAGAVVIV